jgi:hypothetical protein
MEKRDGGIVNSHLGQEGKVHKILMRWRTPLAFVGARCKPFRPSMGLPAGIVSTYTSPHAVRLRAGLRRARELWPLTLRGALVSAAAGGALYVYGFGELDGVWYVAGLGLLALCALALLAVLAAAVRMKLWLRGREPSEASALAVDTRREFLSGFALPRLRFWLFVEVRVSWLAPLEAEARLAEQGALGSEWARLDDHGEVREVLRRIELRDVFGLASLSLRDRVRCAIDVLPHRGALATLAPLHSLAGGDDIPHPMGVAQGDRLELKRYAPGDPARFIHWKVYARTQKLVVRTPERALARAHRTAAFLAAGPGDGPSAAVARVALELGALGPDFRFGADGSPSPVERVDQALVGLRRSSAFRARGGNDLGAFVDQVEREGPAALVVFAPAHAPAVQEQVAALLRARVRPLRVVIGVDGVAGAAPPSLLSRIALQSRGTSSTALRLLQDSVAFYQRLGCDVVVLDRDSGRMLGSAHFAHVARVQAEGRGVAA